MTMHRPLRLLMFVALAFVLVLLVAPSASETLTPDGLLSKLSKDDRVTLTTADGQEKEITVAEMERLAQAQHLKQAEMQQEASAHAATAAASSGTVEYKEDPETAPKVKTESLDAVRKSDPRFAANIELAKQSFAEIQRHGYARGYVLAGFSEKDEAAAADKHRKASAKATKSKTPRRDYRATLLLRAKRDASDSTAKTGTSPTKREVEPLTVAYEVHALLDARGTLARLRLMPELLTDRRTVGLNPLATCMCINRPLCCARSMGARRKRHAEHAAVNPGARHWTTVDCAARDVDRVDAPARECTDVDSRRRRGAHWRRRRRALHVAASSASGASRARSLCRPVGARDRQEEDEGEAVGRDQEDQLSTRRTEEPTAKAHHHHHCHCLAFHTNNMHGQRLRPASADARSTGRTHADTHARSRADSTTRARVGTRWWCKCVLWRSSWRARGVQGRAALRSLVLAHCHRLILSRTRARPTCLVRRSISASSACPCAASSTSPPCM